MNFASIIQDIEGHIQSLQQRLDELKSFDHTTAHDILMTRQEAADFIGKSLRQLDRDCTRFDIPKELINGGVRIRKIHLLRHLGVAEVEEQTTLDKRRESEFDRIRNVRRQ